MFKKFIDSHTSMVYHILDGMLPYHTLHTILPGTFASGIV